MRDLPARTQRRLPTSSCTANIDGPTSSTTRSTTARWASACSAPNSCSWARRSPRRGDPLPDRREGDREAARPPGDDPDVRPRRRQARAVPRGRRARGGQPGARPALDPAVPVAARPAAVPGPAARPAARVEARGDQADVPDDLGRLRAARGQGHRRRRQARAPRAGPRLRREHQARHYDRDAVGGADRGPPREGVRLLLDRDERPHPVHDGGRSRERVRVLPVRAAPPVADPADRHGRRCGARPRTSR